MNSLSGRGCVGLNLGDRDLLNQVLTLGASGAEGSGKAPQVGPLSHMPLWPIMLKRLSPVGRGTQQPFLQDTKLLSFFLPTSFYSPTLPCLGVFAHIPVIATFNHVVS